MSEFHQKFLKPKGRWSSSAAEEISLCAFGKHPGWADHIDLLGAGTESLILLREKLYREGIGGQLDSGAWKKLAPEGKSKGFDHAFIWTRRDAYVVGRLWESQDSRGRGEYPMVIAAEFRGLSFAEALARGFERIEKLAERIRVAADAATVEAAIAEARLEMERPTSTSHFLSAARKEFFAASDFGLNGIGFQRVCFELATEARFFEKGKTIDSDTRPVQIRLPRAVDSVPASLGVWHEVLRDYISEEAPLLLMASSEGWIDLVIGEPTSADFFRLKANALTAPLCSDVPYEVTKEAIELADRLSAGRAAAPAPEQRAAADLAPAIPQSAPAMIAPLPEKTPILQSELPPREAAPAESASTPVSSSGKVDASKRSLPLPAIVVTLLIAVAALVLASYSGKKKGIPILAADSARQSNTAPSIQSNNTPAAPVGVSNATTPTNSANAPETTAQPSVAPAAAANKAPVVFNIALKAPFGETLAIQLSGEDAEKSPLQFEIRSASATNGALNADGSITGRLTFHATQRQGGAHHFEYRAFDGTNYSEWASATINAEPKSDSAPLAKAAIFEAVAGEPKVIALEGTDADGDALTLQVPEKTTLGILRKEGASYVYTAAAAGLDQFQFTATANGAVSKPAVVAITVKLPPLTARNVGGLIAYSGAKTNFSLLREQPFYKSITGEILAAPRFGKAEFQGDNLIYTANSDYSAGDRIEEIKYQVRAADGALSEPARIQVKIPGNPDPFAAYPPVLKGALGLEFVRFTNSALMVAPNKPFYVAKFETSQSAYMAGGGMSGGTAGNIAVCGPGALTNLNAWIQKLNAQTAALGQAFSGYQYRLPTSREWEVYAAPAFGVHEGRRLALKEFAQDSRGRAYTFNPTPCPPGLHDAVGNAGELTSDGRVVGLLLGGRVIERSAMDDETGFRLVLAPGNSPSK